LCPRNPYYWGNSSAEHSRGRPNRVLIVVSP
jgi:hypothetical protein